ncbi:MULTISPECIES: phage tail assembly chaperone [unclassified Pseudomonas]|uniref:phage tail assembly chaperone n=1 Tax=unclassified Pseudomonas TaxID=196821 RepID=UPI002AC8DAEF|nr:MULTISPECIES: phage tail assembly chaperone [unclassified Pseudomonas]MEB0045757.1 phage tail assembly chaperone [Pseudomonas sp. Dout3]MEB0098140.1 phage tail assembly chaperone [Pseudomonas sp. DC1.2]WPX61564.1 phage tail assembly chaperone [Pseudomonas sp. DC1.2]
MYYFSPGTLGFYHSDLHGANRPLDAVVISDDEYFGWVTNAPKGTVLSVGSDRLPERTLLVAQTDEDIARAWRDKALEMSQWLVNRDNEEMEMGEGTTLSAIEFKELLAYRRLLRDWPSMARFPDVESLPAEPEWLVDALRKDS